MNYPLSTRQAAAALGCTYWQLWCLLRDRIIDPPRHKIARIFAWTPEDIARARAALAVRRHVGRPRKAVPA